MAWVEIAATRFVCASSDEKPTPNQNSKIQTGSEAIEYDTGERYFYDGQQWVEIAPVYKGLLTAIKAKL